VPASSIGTLLKSIVLLSSLNIYCFKFIISTLTIWLIKKTKVMKKLLALSVYKVRGKCD
jgi:ABC-type uncharacterized transport system permease subunit